MTFYFHNVSSTSGYLFLELKSTMELEKVLKTLVDIEMERYNQFIMRETINLRVIFRVAALLGTDMSTVYATMRQQRVDPTVSEVIAKMWKKEEFVPTCVTATAKSDYESIIKNFLSQDFLNPNDLSKFCLALKKSRFSDKAQTVFWILFAVDGLNGLDYKNYVKNLAIPLEYGEQPSDTKISNTKKNVLDDEENEEGPGVTHVRAIRSIYCFFNRVTPQELGKSLRNLYEIREENEADNTTNSDSEDDESKQMDDSSNESDNEENTQNEIVTNHIENYYKKIVGKKISAVASWLKDEQENLRKMKERQRKRKMAIDRVLAAKRNQSEF